MMMCPRGAEGQSSFYAEKSTQSLLHAHQVSKQAVVLLHIVPRQLDEEISRQNNSIQEVDTRDQGVPDV
jgi:hypothetical protein